MVRVASLHQRYAAACGIAKALRRFLGRYIQVVVHFLAFYNLEHNQMILLSDRIGKILEGMREKNHGGEMALAQLADTSETIVHGWLSGQIARIDYRSAKKISEKLGWQVEWLINGRGPATSPPNERLSEMLGGEVEDEIGSTKSFLTAVTSEEMRLLIFCRKFPDAAKIFYRIATDTARK